MAGLEKNLTGDSLIYMAGLRWKPPLSGRLVPYVQVLFGGNKVTQELMFPQRIGSRKGRTAAHNQMLATPCRVCHSGVHVGPPNSLLTIQWADSFGFKCISQS